MTIHAIERKKQIETIHVQHRDRGGERAEAEYIGGWFKGSATVVSDSGVV